MNKTDEALKLAKECGATTYTNRHYPDATAVTFSPLAWENFCEQVLEQPPTVQEPVAILKGIDEYGPVVDWYRHWVTVPIGTKFYTAPPAQPAPAQPTVDWREAVLDLIDECPGLTMDQDRWLTQRVKEIATTPAALEKTYDPCPGCTPGHVCRTSACGRLQLPQNHPLRNTQ
jgi:hypothetical protein